MNSRNDMEKIEIVMQARLAQSVERETLNLNVVGSSPTLGGIFLLLLKTRPTTNKNVLYSQSEKKRILATYVCIPAQSLSKLIYLLCNDPCKVKIFVLDNILHFREGTQLRYLNTQTCFSHQFFSLFLFV